MSFTTFGLSPELLRGIQSLGYTEATPIQRDAIPPAMAGRDVLACAMTGSGKTAAFVLPILQRLTPKKRGVVRCLVLTPTRELAAQICEQVFELGKHSPVRGASIHGGVGMGPQETALRRGVDVIVATPGRLLDHFGHPYGRIDDLEVLVLDEADRMLDMGFLPDIRRILNHLPKKPRQTLFFSATMPAPIAALAREMLKNPVSINIERKALPATGVSQSIYPCPQERKTALFMEILKRNDVKSILAFTRTKHRANRLADFLDKNGVNCARIHGNRSQAQRTLALEGFKAGRHRVLVATDIAARGIDIDALSLVLNFDVPGMAEDYIHRVGRTARAQALGEAITFAAPDEDPELRQIERAIGKSVPRVTLPNFDYRAKAAERFEVPIAERIAAIRARKSEERARARENAARRSGGVAGGGHTSAPAHGQQRSGQRGGNTHNPRETPTSHGHRPAVERGPQQQAPGSSQPTQQIRSDGSGTVTFTPMGQGMQWPRGFKGGRR